MATHQDNSWLVALFSTCETAPKPAQPSTQYTKNPTPCPKCSGSGRLSAFSHIKGGECFKCNGSGAVYL